MYTYKMLLDNLISLSPAVLEQEVKAGFETGFVAVKSLKDITDVTDGCEKDIDGSLYLETA